MRSFALAAAVVALLVLPGTWTASAASWSPGRNDYTIAMADGTTIDATMWVPEGTAPGAQLPAVVVIHGYGGSKAVGEAHRAADHGYVGFAYSTRGFGKSTGQMDVAGPNSLGDLKELIRWLKANGPVDAAKVGVTGASYGGGHSVQIATDPDAGVATVVPIVPWTDLLQALQPNHVMKLTYTAGFYATGNGLVQSGDQPVALEVAGQNLGRRQLYDTYDPTVHAGFASIVAGVGQSDLEAFARERSAALKVANIRIPIFLVQGLSDDLFPGDQVLPFFDLIPTEEKKLYLGFVGHPRASGSGPEIDYVYGLVYQWFDHYLKGLGAKPFDPARPIEVARTPWDGTTLQLASWPAGSQATAYHFNSDGSLGALAGTPGVGAIVNTLAAGVRDDYVLRSALPVGDAQAAAPDGTPADTLAFRSANLTVATELLGTPRAELTFTAVGRSVQFSVKVFDRAPDGTLTLVTKGIYGMPDHVAGLHEHILFDLQPYRYTFEAGHAVEVHVAASDFPSFLPEKTPFAAVLDLGAGGSFVRLPLGAGLP